MTLVHTTPLQQPATPVGTGDGTAFDLTMTTVRELNRALRAATSGSFTVRNPAGRHNLAVGLDAPLEVTIDGHAGYYCAGMNQLATVTVTGNTAVGVAENMMSGRVEILGAAGQAAAATAHGGLLVVRGNAAARCGISLKGADIVVEGNVGHATGFLSQKGRILVCGDAGEVLGDSLYETRIYVRGSVASLGADCIEKPVRAEHLAEIQELLDAAGTEGVSAGEFRRYGSARALYHFTADRIEAK
ncbi:MAG: protein glxC [Solirubrobacteraceae bacterium]|nr:protein glxC [Solirubrobacteraceae bacterium]